VRAERRISDSDQPDLGSVAPGHPAVPVTSAERKRRAPAPIQLEVQLCLFEQLTHPCELSGAVSQIQRCLPNEGGVLVIREQRATLVVLRQNEALAFECNASSFPP
jgi:hypothetical protein